MNPLKVARDPGALRLAFEATGLTHRALADKAGVGVTTVWRAINGQPVSPAVATAITQALAGTLFVDYQRDADVDDEPEQVAA